jgi:hypothetical protein
VGLPGHGVPILDGFGDRLRQLSGLPRRRMTPRTLIERAGRLARFNHGLLRRRKPLPN